MVEETGYEIEALNPKSLGLDGENLESLDWGIRPEIQ
jgi:hypothetical protein